MQAVFLVIPALILISYLAPYKVIKARDGKWYIKKWTGKVGSGPFGTRTEAEAFFQDWYT